jgi:hypothetical protein
VKSILTRKPGQASGLQAEVPPDISRGRITDFVPCGTRKTHIAHSLGHCAIRAGYGELFTPVSKMLARFYGARPTKALGRHFAKLAAVEFLIIDDFGPKPLKTMRMRTSMEIGVRVETEDLLTGQVTRTASAYLTFVALGNDLRPTEVPFLDLKTADEIRRNKEGKKRRELRLAEKKSEKACQEDVGSCT